MKRHLISLAGGITAAFALVIAPMLAFVIAGGTVSPIDAATITFGAAIAPLVGALLMELRPE